MNEIFRTSTRWLRLGQFVKFCLVGGSGVVVHLTSFHLLANSGIGPEIHLAVSRESGVIAAYSGMNKSSYLQAIADYIRANARPPDKFSHQPRLYQLAKRLADGRPFDDDVLFAAVWMHDLGVFIGHRPEDPTALAGWDNIAYAMSETPGLLRSFGFPMGKIPAVVEVIRTHLPSSKPTSFEGALMRDADILEQLGAVGILRTVSKVGRDTRFIRFGDALTVLRRNLEQLPARLQLASARRLAEPRIQLLKAFLEAAEVEAGGTEW